MHRTHAIKFIPKLTLVLIWLRSIALEWKPTEKDLKKSYFLKLETQLAKNNHFPDKQSTTAIIPTLAPNKALKKPKTLTSLLENTQMILLFKWSKAISHREM